MKRIFLFIFSIAVFSSCSQYKVQDLYGAWQIDKILLDGMDRTDWPMLEFPWGSGMEIKADGKFRTNFPQEEMGKGNWKVSSDGKKLRLHFSTDKSSQFEVTLSQQYLVLKSLRWQIFLSRVEALPKPAKKEVHLANNLPGRWYFYEMNTKDSLVQYPRAKKYAHWVHIDPAGYYRSGEGKHESFHGRWVLKEDTLTFSELDRAWKEQWKVRVEGNMLYFESLGAEQEKWYEVSLVHETRLND
ncbi:hypothetical protein WJR50_18550 [Catalinimonas sp. 4WD22]|uniref:hypothetical protein n=1 Tax=Catalinimonas locisalis TaxID=3133978 RepID=UPI00310132E7